MARGTPLQSRRPLTHTHSISSKPPTPLLQAYSVTRYLNEDENIPVFIPRIGNPSAFRREDETLLAPQGTSNASSREIYPKLYANSITAINTGENHLSLGMRELSTNVLEITYLCNL